MQSRLPPWLNPQNRSLARGNLFVWLSLIFAILLSRFPHTRPSLFIALPLFSAIAGTADTVRCLQKRWSFYHGGVLLCLYGDLMALSLILFLLIYPYTHTLSSLN